MLPSVTGASSPPMKRNTLNDSRFQHAAHPSADTTYMRLRGNSTQVMRITQDGSGHLQIRNSANTVVATFTAAITNSAWVRVEFDVTPSVAAGAVSVKLFNTTDGTTATETQSVTSQALGIAYVDEVSWGQVASASNAPTMYLDDLQLNATGFPGPLGGGPADQGVTLTGTATGSAYGSPTVTTTAEVSLTGTASAAAVGQPAVAPDAVAQQGHEIALSLGFNTLSLDGNDVLPRRGQRQRQKQWLRTSRPKNWASRTSGSMSCTSAC